MMDNPDICRADMPSLKCKKVRMTEILLTLAAFSCLLSTGCQLSHRPQFPVGDPKHITVRMGEKTTNLADTHGVAFKNCSNNALQSVESLVTRPKNKPTEAELEGILKGDVVVLGYDSPQKISFHEQNPPQGTALDSDGFTVVEGIFSIVTPLDGNHTGLIVLTGKEGKIIDVFKPSAQLSRRSLAETLAVATPMMPDTE